MINTKELFKTMKVEGSIKLTLRGVSMMPMLLDGDKISIVQQTEYSLGDILVYLYGSNRLVVHRLLKKKGDTLYCKGDNSFLLEHVNIKDVLGKVVCVERDNMKVDLAVWDEELINLSYAISKEFRLCGYKKELLYQSQVFNDYTKRFLGEKRL